MARTLSEFHYSTLFIESSAFADAERFHDEMAFKLGLPSWYGRNLDALLDCLSSNRGCSRPPTFSRHNFPLNPRARPCTVGVVGVPHQMRYILSG
jgi:hypothetical protein